MDETSPDALPSVVADVLPEHVGWLVKVFQERRDDRLGVIISTHDTIVLGKGFTRGPSAGCVRRWTRPDGTEWVGLVDDVTGPGVVGTEHSYPAETPCEFVRLIKRRSRR